MTNTLLCTDVYKLGHMLQYPPGTTKVYSYLQARSDKELPETVFFGLHYYLQKYLAQGFVRADADEFYDIYASILGPVPDGVRSRIEALLDIGYWPVEIKAVPEGEVMPVRNVLMTITNTHPEFYWCVGYLESLLLKVWNTITVASYSLKLRRLVHRFAQQTCDNFDHLPFQVHDFGYRGVSSEETAELSGAAHLLNFLGSDTVPAVKFLRDYYEAVWPIGLSVPATEHSVMCSYGPENELEAFSHILDVYPNGIVSIVSDTYDLWKVLTEYGPKLHKKIMARDGRLVFRPDSGDPQSIICGTPVSSHIAESMGALELLWQTFGGTTNSKGYRVLDSHVGLIYGDGFFFDRFDSVLSEMERQGWASSNLVVGIGGLLLQAHSRDELGFAIKATFAEIDGRQRELFKDPVTDSKKRSHKGMLRLTKLGPGQFITYDQQGYSSEGGYLKPVYRDGKILTTYTLEEIRNRLTESTGLTPLVLPAPVAA